MSARLDDDFVFLGDDFFPEYYITNCGVPTKEEIAFVLAKINE